MPHSKLQQRRPRHSLRGKISQGRERARYALSFGSKDTLQALYNRLRFQIRQAGRQPGQEIQNWGQPVAAGREGPHRVSTSQRRPLRIFPLRDFRNRP